jgi:hypothetical protein
MLLNEKRAARANGTARHDQSPCKGAVTYSTATIALPVQIRRRRAAAQRLTPLADGRSDPLDGLAVAPTPRVVEYGTYDVVTLGLVCSHGPDCTGHVGQAAEERQGDEQRKAA